MRIHGCKCACIDFKDNWWPLLVLAVYSECDSVLNKECGNKSMKSLNFGWCTGFQCVPTPQIICLTATFNTCIKVWRQVYWCPCCSEWELSDFTYFQPDWLSSCVLSRKDRGEILLALKQHTHRVTRYSPSHFSIIVQHLASLSELPCHSSAHL